MPRIFKITPFVIILFTTVLGIVAFMILQPILYSNTTKSSYRLNECIDDYPPVYTPTATKSLEFNMESSYLFRLGLENKVKIRPTPRNIEGNKFLGYIEKNTKLKIMLEGADDSYKKGPFSELFAVIDIIPGNQVITRPGFGRLAGQQIELRINIEEKNLNIKLENEGILWNTYEAGTAYVVTMTAKRIKVIEVTPEMMKKWKE